MSADHIMRGLTFSPDGNYLYYVVTDHQNPATLYKVPVLGGSATKVIEDIGVIGEVHPARVSPDGQLLAFTRFNRSQKEEALMIAKTDGTGERMLAWRKLPDKLGLGWRAGPAWSPDGKAVACAVGIADPHGYYGNVIEVGVASGAERLLSCRG